MYCADAETENIGASDKTQLQTGPAYSADQSSYGGIHTPQTQTQTQTYYPVCISCFS